MTFRTKPTLALELSERALDAGVPRRWVTGDEVCGGGRRLRFRLEQRRQRFVLAVARNEPLWQDGPVYRPAQELAAALAASAWQRRSAGDGAKGPREYNWAWQPVWRWQLTAEERAWGHGPVVRRSLEDPSELAYDVAFASREGTTLETLIQVAGRRWANDVGFERAKQDCGLDAYEGRTWDAWHRHITLALLAQAFLVALSTHAKKGTEADLIPLTAPEVHHLVEGFLEPTGIDS